MSESRIIPPPSVANSQYNSGQPNGGIMKNQRSSNLELYRIICMLMIVAHHYVVNSGLMAANGPILLNSDSSNSIFLLLFGAWGKTGINCFLMITGYFMCTSQITIRKFLKLFLQIYFYRLLLFPIFLAAGYESLSPLRLVKLIMPLWGIKDGFIGCFLVFYLTIPFWNILIKNMSKRQHLLLLCLLLMCYTFLGSVPTFDVTFNYVTWFGIIYLIASFIRLYPRPVFEKRNLWGWLSLLSVLLAVASVMVMNRVYGPNGSPRIDFFFLSDSNKLLAVTVAVFSFLWFKNLNIKYSKVINAFGAATFGVLLIHANSDAMRRWLWLDLVDGVGHYSLTLGSLGLYSVGVVLAVFIACNLIDQLRIATVEKQFFRWYDKKLSEKANHFVSWLIYRKQY